MKNFILLLFGFLAYSFSYGDTNIEMEEYGGVYRVPCTVNGAKMKFIFDTGASNICLSLPMAEYLLDNGYLDQSDIKGSGTSSVADGRIVDHIIVNLKDVEIGGKHLYNVDAIVIDGQNAPLLMGQSALKKLGKYSIERNYLVIQGENYSLSNLYNDKDVDVLFDEAYDAYSNGDYHNAALIYEYLYDNELLSIWGKYLLIESLCSIDKFHKALTVIDEIESTFGKENPESEYRLYELKGRCLREIGDGSSALLYYNKAVRFLPLIYKWREEDLRINFLLSRCYIKNKDYFGAQRTMKNYIENYLDFFSISSTDCWDKKYKDKLLGEAYYYLSLTFDLNRPYEEKNYDKYNIISAAWGYPDAIEICKQYNLKFENKPYKYEYQ